MGRILLAITAITVATALAACDEDPFRPNGSDPPDPPGDAIVLPVLGHGQITDRFSAEVAVAGNTAYTTTWGFRLAPGNALYIWDVAGAAPLLVDSVLVTSASTLGDVQISPDGSLLVVPTEPQGSLLIFDRSEPRALQLINRYESASIGSGVHTVKLAEVDGTLYGFLQINPGEQPARLVILDLSDPAQPVQLLSRTMGNPFIHDVFVRDGVLFAALWHDGMSIFDIGGGGQGGSPSNPVLLGNIRQGLSSIHNIWWLHDPETGSKRYALLGQEGPGSVGTGASGDIHVVDVSDMSAPAYVARYRVSGAGAHNFSADEASGVLYAAYYNGGVRALDVRGELGVCEPGQRTSTGVCDLRLMGRELGVSLNDDTHYVWGVAFQQTHLYASDMVSGIYKLDVSALIR